MNAILTPKQLSILLWLRGEDSDIAYITHPSELKELEDRRLIIRSLGNDKYILSYDGNKIVDKVVSFSHVLATKGEDRGFNVPSKISAFVYPH